MLENEWIDKLRYGFEVCCGLVECDAIWDCLFVGKDVESLIDT